MILVRDVYNWLNHFAPFDTQEGFDNAGLTIGDPLAKVSKVLFALDTTLPVVQEAVEWGAELIVSHHPLMFGGTKTIRYDDPEGATIAELIGARMNFIAAHTNFDQAEGGTGDSMIAALGLTDKQSNGLYLRTGSLEQPMSAAAFLRHVDSRLGACARMYGAPDAMISRVTVGPGGIGDEYALAIEAGSQAYVVGEIGHHQVIPACAKGLVVYEAGHYASELSGVAALQQKFASEAKHSGLSVESRLTTIAPYVYAK